MLGFCDRRAARQSLDIFANEIALENLAPFQEPSASERARLALRYVELVASGIPISSENLTHARSQIMRFLKCRRI
ncbi:MAG: hypothetical protein ACLUKN_11795 [Bacilli bacterium]